jgi:hypothetical protein
MPKVKCPTCGAGERVPYLLFNTATVRCGSCDSRYTVAFGLFAGRVIDWERTPDRPTDEQPDEQPD